MAGDESGATRMLDAPLGLGIGPTIGIVMNLVGSTLINVGSNLIKLAHIKRLNRAKTQMWTLRRAPSNSTSTTQTSLLHEEEAASVQRRRRCCCCYCCGDVDVHTDAPHLWLAGWFVFIFGNMLNFASFSFTTQSLLAP